MAKKNAIISDTPGEEASSALWLSQKTPFSEALCNDSLSSLVSYIKLGNKDKYYSLFVWTVVAPNAFLSGPHFRSPPQN